MLLFLGAVVVRTDVSILFHGGGVLRVFLPHQPDAGCRGPQLRGGVADHAGGNDVTVLNSGVAPKRIKRFIER